MDPHDMSISMIESCLTMSEWTGRSKLESVRIVFMRVPEMFAALVIA
jgi:hypothetical protein